MRVLLVEDELLLRRIAGAMLTKLGCEVTSAGNGEEALGHLDSSWDLVLMDCQMPTMNGLDATRKWRAREAGHTPIIALTGATSDEERARCLEAGMDDFVSKPLSPDKIGPLLARVKAKRGTVPSAPLSPPMQELVAQYAGFESLLLELARAFESQLPTLTAQLGELIEDDEAAPVFEAAHALKGKAMSLHAHELVQTLAQIETRAQNGDLEGCRALWPQARIESQKAGEPLCALIESLKALAEG